MNFSRKQIALICVLLLGVVSVYNSCESYRPASTRKTSTLGNPNRGDTVFAAGKYGQISSLSVCVEELVLTGINGAPITVPYATSSELSIPMDGMELGALPVPPGQYTKISLELSNRCGTGRSVALTNDQGTFVSSADVSLKFSGNEFVGIGTRKIVLDLQTLAVSLSQVGSNSNVPPAVANALGNYHSIGCGMQSEVSSVAFCDTFDRPSNAAGRGGQLNNLWWSVLRAGIQNQGQQNLNTWPNSTIDACGTLQAAQAGSDLLICNGQLRQSQNDDGNRNFMTMSITRPFDFTGRTGTVAFDVTNDTSGIMGTWPEFWLTDTPGSRFPRNGVILRFSGSLIPFQGNVVPGCPTDNNRRWNIGSAVVIRNYVQTEYSWSWDDSPSALLQSLSCVIAPSGPNAGMNHIELKVSQNEIEVWASDAGSPLLTKIAVLRNLALPFSKGYISLGDHHNNAAMSPRPETANHTYAWDNVTFDGPVLARDLNFSVLDRMEVWAPGLINLGWESNPAEPASIATLPLSAAEISAIAASGKTPVLKFTFHVSHDPLINIQYTVNGVALSAPLPFATVSYDNYTVELPVPVNALVVGPQNISIWSNSLLLIGNADLRIPEFAP